MRKIYFLLPTLVFLLSFGVYVFTLNPSISAADSTEIVTTSIVLGVPHQPGYPVNTLLGHFFSKIPYGPLPWRVNLMSAFLQALTVTLVYFVILKLYGMAIGRLGRPAKAGLPAPEDDNLNPSSHTLYPYYFLAASASLFLAFSLEFWQFATRAEVFPLNNFFAAALTLIAVSWWEKIQGLGVRVQGLGKTEINGENSIPYSLDPKPSFSLPRKIRQKYSAFVKYLPEEVLGRWGAYQPSAVVKTKKAAGFSLRLLYLLAFVSGLAFTHHQTITLLFPALAFLLLSFGLQLWWKKDVLAKLLLCFLLGILPYFSLIPMSRANPPVRWGEPNDVEGLFKTLTRSDYGTFSPYAQNPAEFAGEKPKETPIIQQIFYLKSLNHDFTLLGLALAALGGWALFRQRRKIFIFLALGFFFTGPFFFGFANYNLESGFHQAVTKRFQMLPDQFFTIFLAFGLLFLWEKFESLKLDLREKKNLFTGFLVLTGLVLVPFYPLERNFKNADNRKNSLTINYARDALSPVPRDAIILISGDITIFAFEYWQTLIEKKNDRIIFSPGLLYLDWYVARLKKNYPEIIMPPTPPGRLQPSTTEIIDANWGRRPIYVSPELARYDPELEKKYVLWPKDLLFLVKKKGEELKLESYRAENEALWQTHDLSLFERTIKNNPLLEYGLVPEYARHYLNIGSVFESVKLYDDAIREYERALKIHSGFPDPYRNLGRIYGFKLQNKDYQKAFANFQMFLATALPSQEEDIKVVKEAMGILQENAIKESTRSAAASDAADLSTSPLDEASGSGKIATPSAAAID